MIPKVEVEGRKEEEEYALRDLHYGLHSRMKSMGSVVIC
jgi:hypothetical protein